MPRGKAGAASGIVLHDGEPEDKTRHEGGEPCEGAQSIAAHARRAEDAAPDRQEEAPGDEADHRRPHSDRRRGPAEAPPSRKCFRDMLRQSAWSIVSEFGKLAISRSKSLSHSALSGSQTLPASMAGLSTPRRVILSETGSMAS